MTEANRKSHRRSLTTAACLAMAIVIAALAGTAYAGGGDSGGKGDGRDREHEKKHSDRANGVIDPKDFFDQIEGVKHPPGDPGGEKDPGGGGSGSGGGKAGTCSRC